MADIAVNQSELKQIHGDSTKHCKCMQAKDTFAFGLTLSIEGLRA